MLKTRNGQELLNELKLMKKVKFIQMIAVIGVQLINYQHQVAEKFGLLLTVKIIKQLIGITLSTVTILNLKIYLQ